VFGLGAAWVLDELQITISSSVTRVLTQPDTLEMTSTEIGLIASIYLVGAVFGALVFGRVSDKLGRPTARRTEGIPSILRAVRREPSVRTSVHTTAVKGI
jgi:MFS family permease